MSKHTSPPYRIGNLRFRPGVIQGDIRIETATGVYVATVRAGAASTVDREVHELTAEFIVTACNAFEAMVEALDAAKELAAVAEGLTGCQSDDEFVWGVQKKIDTALALARGERS